MKVRGVDIVDGFGVYEVSRTSAEVREHLATLVRKEALYTISKKRPLTPKEQERLQIELGMMRMLCDTCYILDQRVKDSPKLDEFEKVLDDIMRDDPSRKIIVFSEWTRMLDLLIGRLDKKGLDYALHTGQVPQKRRREEIRRFKEDSDCRLFLASESGGVGLNLQTASVVVNLDLPSYPPVFLSSRANSCGGKIGFRPSCFRDWEIV